MECQQVLSKLLEHAGMDFEETPATRQRTLQVFLYSVILLRPSTPLSTNHPHGLLLGLVVWGPMVMLQMSAECATPSLGRKLPEPAPKPAGLHFAPAPSQALESRCLVALGVTSAPHSTPTLFCCHADRKMEVGQGKS